MSESAPDVRKLIQCVVEYEQEIQRVRSIDPIAADYMDGPARELPCFMVWVDDDNYDVNGSVAWAFTWSNTPQGYDYWSYLDGLLTGGITWQKGA